MSVVEDRLAITDVVNGWLHRDNKQWDELAGLFHEDAEITLAWFSGSARDFVAASRNVRLGGMLSKHFMGTPVVEISGDRALAETNFVIPSDHVELNLGVVAHARFFDRISKREGVWRIERRNSIYDTAAFTFPTGPVEIDKELFVRFPRESAAFAYVLAKSGLSLDGELPTRGSAREAEIKTTGRAWLHGR